MFRSAHRRPVCEYEIAVSPGNLPTTSNGLKDEVRELNVGEMLIQKGLPRSEEISQDLEGTWDRQQAVGDLRIGAIVLAIKDGPKS